MAGQNKQGVKAEYCIFDVDGLLSGDTEVIYTQVTNAIVGRYGYTMTMAIKQQLMGKPYRESTECLFDNLPGLSDHISIDDYLKEKDEMQQALFRKVKPLQGAVELVEHLSKSGVQIAVATGSNRRNLKIKTSHLPHLFDHFHPDTVMSADSEEVPKGRGKPCPDIFLAAARALGRDVGDGLTEPTEAQVAERRKGMVFEDAVLGLHAGVSAGMNVVWIPDPELRALHGEEQHGAAVVLKSLADFKPDAWGLPAMS